jgi:NAD(P)-dependent dehydrogenase (short-subunit alcohol dehydrogenase family)
VVQNIASRDGMRAAVMGLAERCGRLDVLVNNAAWVRYQAVPDIAPETVERMLEVGFKSVIWGIQAAAEAMDAERGGSIVNIASVAGLRSAPNSIVYSGVKAGVMGITRAAAAELGGRGIRVNAIAPSAVPTEGTQRNRDAERDAKRIARTPLGRLGTAEDIARAIGFLATDQASFVTGQVLVVDGGTTTTTL